MPNLRITLLLQYSLQSLLAIEQYFLTIDNEEDFVSRSSGRMAFDAICMRLQVFGENLKRLKSLHPVFSHRK